MVKALVGRRIGPSIIFLFLLLSNPAAAQVDTLSEVKDGTLPIVGQLVVGGDTIPWSVLDEVSICSQTHLERSSGTQKLLQSYQKST